MVKQLASFDLVSDLHLDHWVSPRHYPESVTKELTIDRVRSLIPDNPSEVLVIAGDLGHFNEYNQLALETLSEVYAHILLVRGNHDLYLLGEVRGEFPTSTDRWNNMKDRVSHLKGVHFLEGDTVQIGGVTFGGTGMWYDMQYAIQEKRMPKMMIHAIWRIVMNDGNYIKGLPSFEEEYNKLERLFNDSLDVVITHVGPDWTHARNEYNEDKLMNSFYYFDGQAILNRAKGKIWCFGHVHEHYDYTYKGCRLINNAVGYPSGALDTKIRTVFL